MVYMYIQQADTLAYWKNVGWAHVKELIDKNVLILNCFVYFKFQTKYTTMKFVSKCTNKIYEYAFLYIF